MLDAVELISIIEMQYFCRSILGLRRAFSFASSKEQVLTLSRELLENYRSYRPWKNIRLIHQVTMSRYDPEVQTMEKTATWRQDQAKIHQIINQISAYLHLVPHEDLNLLLHVLKQRGYTYNKELAVFRALNKLARMLLGKQFRAEILPKTLHYLKALRFPKVTTIKMLQEFADMLQIGSEQELQKISLTNLLRVVIFSIEEPSITFPIVKSLLRYALKQNATTLSSQCALYHIRTILPNALKAKIEYQATKSNARSILFNPYEASSAEDSEAPHNHTTEPKEYKDDVSEKLTEMAGEIGKLFTDSVEIKRLEAAIVSSARLDLEPLTKESMIYVSDIAQLRPFVEDFLVKNLDSLTPVQLIYLCKRCKDIAQDQIKSYLEKLGPHMSLQETAYLLFEAHKHFHHPLTADTILQLIDTLPTLDYSNFVAIARLTELLPRDQAGKIKEILDAVQRKMEGEKGSQSPQG